MAFLWPSGLGNYFVCKRFAVQTLLWPLEFVIQINLEHDTIAIRLMKMKMKNRPYRYDIIGPRSRHAQKCCKYQKCLSMMILKCIKQRLSNIWSSVHEKVKQHWGWVAKKPCLLKTCILLLTKQFEIEVTICKCSKYSWSLKVTNIR